MSKRAQRYDCGMQGLERWQLQRLRRALLQEVVGQVLEIGAGTGANLDLYQDEADVIALDRNWDMLSGLAAKHPTSIHLNAEAERLPLPSSAFDYVVGAFVFCSISNPGLALSEIRRVLKPDGQLRLLEHVRGLHPLTRRMTDLLNPFWVRMTNECHLNRETALTVEQSGFQLLRTQTYAWGLLQRIDAVSAG